MVELVAGLIIGGALGAGFALAASGIGIALDLSALLNAASLLVALCIGLTSISIARESQRREAARDLRAESVALSRTIIVLGRLRGFLRAHLNYLDLHESDLYFTDVRERCDSIIESRLLEGASEALDPSGLPIDSARTAVVLREFLLDTQKEIKSIQQNASAYISSHASQRRSNPLDEEEINHRFERSANSLSNRLALVLRACTERIETALQTFRSDELSLNHPA